MTIAKKNFSTLVFFIPVLILYFVAGILLQKTGLVGIFLSQTLFLLFPSILFSYQNSAVENGGILETRRMTTNRGGRTVLERGVLKNTLSDKNELPTKSWRHYASFLNFAYAKLRSYVHAAPLWGWPTWKFPRVKDIFLTFLGMLLISLFIDYGISWQDYRYPPPPQFQAAYQALIQISSLQEALLKIFVLALTPAFIEEILFRGILQPNWISQFGKTYGVIFTSLAFALAHGNFRYFHFYFILGLFLGIVLEWRGSLWLPVIAHFTNNLWTLLGPQKF